MNLAELENIGPIDVKRLARVGIRTPLALLKRGYTPDLRKKLSQETGISESLLLDWVRFADLLRVEGIGLEYASLLREIGIDSSEALAVQNAKSLAERLKRSNEEASNRVYRLPSLKQITKAIKSASKVSHGPHSLSGDSTTAPPPPKRKRKKRNR